MCREKPGVMGKGMACADVQERQEEREAVVPPVLARP